MAFSSETTLRQSDAAKSAAAASAGGGAGGGGGVSDWDDLTGTLSGPVPFETVDADGNPVSRGADFDGDGVPVRWERDPTTDAAMRVVNEDTDTDLVDVDESGNVTAAGDVAAFGSNPQSQNSLLAVKDSDGNAVTMDAAEVQFTGAAISDVSSTDDKVTVDVSGGGSPTDILEGGTERVADATDVDFASADFDVTDEGGGEAGVSLAEDYLLASDYTPEADTHDAYTDSDAVDAINNDPDHGSTASHNYFSGDHADLSGIGEDDHHAKSHDHSESDIATIPDGGLTEDYLLSSEYTPVSDVEGAGLSNSNSIAVYEGQSSSWSMRARGDGNAQRGGLQVIQPSTSQGTIPDLPFQAPAIELDRETSRSQSGMLVHWGHGDKEWWMGATADDWSIWDDNQNKALNLTQSGDLSLGGDGNFDITGNADSVDGYDGSDLAVLSEDETVTGNWDFLGSSGSPLSVNSVVEVGDGGSNNLQMGADDGNGYVWMRWANPGSSGGVPVALTNAGAGFGGETDPSYAVDVDGDINATGVGRFNITGDADSVDGYDASDLAVLAEDETFTGQVTFQKSTQGTPVIYKGQDTGAANIAFVEYRQSDGTRTAFVGDASTEDEDLYLGADVGGLRLWVSGSTRGYIDPSGNMGLGGETNPSYAADVDGTVRAQDSIRIPAPNATGGDAYEIQPDGSGNLEILTPNGNRQKFFNDGDIGAFQ